MEYEHHGDRLVPRRRALQPVHPLADARARRARPQHLGAAPRRRRRLQGQIAPLTGYPQTWTAPGLLDRRPHTATSTRTCRTTNSPHPESAGLRVLGPPARRPRTDPHPFTAAGNTEFNALIWMPPAGERAGDIVLIDSTHFTTLFGGTDSLRNLWRNLATMK